MYKYSVFQLLFLLYSFSAQSQQSLETLQSQLDTASPTVRVDLLNSICDHYESVNLDTAMIFAKQAMLLAEEIDYERGIFKSLCNVGIIYSNGSDYSEALAHMKRALNYAQKMGNLKYESQANTFLGVVYYNLSDKNTALSYYLASLKQKEATGDLPGQAVTLNNISTIYRDKEKYDLAKEYVLRAIELNTAAKDTLYLMTNFVNLAVIYEDNEQYDSAMLIYETALPIAKQIDLKFDQAILYGNMGSIRGKQGRFEESIPLLSKSLKLKQEVGNTGSTAYAHYHFCRAYHAMSALDSAQSHAERGLALLERTTNTKLKLQHELALILADKQLYKPAFENLTEYMGKKDSIFNKTKNRQFEQIQALYETEKKEKEISLLQKKNEVQRVIQIGLAGGFLLLIALASAIMNRQRLRIKKNKELALNQAKLLEAEKSLVENERKIHKQELGLYLANLNQKNALLEELRQEMETLSESTNTKDELRLVLVGQLIDASLLTESDWEEFKMVFQQVHTNFFVKLRDCYPNLSPAEIRLLSLLKLDMDNKGIANMQGISVESVHKSKYRLRKKLSLTAKDDLQELLEKI